MAKVSKPVGRSIKVAGSSFIAVRNTNTVPRPMPGAAIGATTFLITIHWFMPRVDATSFTLVGTRDSEELMLATDFARNNRA